MNAEDLAARKHWTESSRQCTVAEEERDRYRIDREDLLAVLFQDYDTRSHVAAAILAGDSNAKQIPSSRQTGSSQSG